MNKSFLIAASISLFLAGCTTPPYSNNLTTTPSSNTNQTVTPSGIQNDNTSTTQPTTQTFQSNEYKFKFNYPSNFQLTNPNYGNLSDKIAQVQVNSDQYPNTNLADAAFTVSADTNIDSLNSCLSKNLPEGSSKFTDTTNINNLKFYWNSGTGAAAGNRYETKNYRTFTNNTCLEISETIHTGNIGNYPESSNIKEVNKDDIWQELDQILQSFQTI